MDCLKKCRVIDLESNLLIIPAFLRQTYEKPTNIKQDYVIFNHSG